MKKFLLTAFLCIPLLTFAQTNNRIYYIYSDLKVFYPGILNRYYQAQMDTQTGWDDLKDETGKKLKFTSKAALLLYLQLQGWEIYDQTTNIEGKIQNEKGDISTHYRWHLRKPCTKEEAEEIVAKSIPK